MCMVRGRQWCWDRVRLVELRKRQIQLSELPAKVEGGESFQDTHLSKIYIMFVKPFSNNPSPWFPGQIIRGFKGLADWIVDIFFWEEEEILESYPRCPSFCIIRSSAFYLTARCDRCDFWRPFHYLSHPKYGKLLPTTMLYCDHMTWTVIVISWSQDWKIINIILSWYNCIQGLGCGGVWGGLEEQKRMLSLVWAPKDCKSRPVKELPRKIPWC